MYKHEYNIGDKVKVVNDGATYGAFEGWFNNNAPEYRQYWRKNYSPKEIYQEDEEKNVFSIVFVQRIDLSENKPKYRILIQAYNGYAYLVNERAIEKINYKINLNDIVVLNNTQCAYTNFVEWLENIKSVFTEQYFQSLKNQYVENKLPTIGHRYKVIFYAPKATIPPFHKETLYLIQDIETKEMFIVGSEGLFIVK
ncbi:MAG: hypothetical protein ACI37Z_05010 [Candidatus Gastranaerophilaceae bacterium]